MSLKVVIDRKYVLYEQHHYTTTTYGVIWQYELPTHKNQAEIILWNDNSVLLHMENMGWNPSILLVYLTNKMKKA